jgi:hypothetical protein
MFRFGSSELPRLIALVWWGNCVARFGELRCIFISGADVWTTLGSITDRDASGCGAADLESCFRLRMYSSRMESCLGDTC